MGKENRGNGHGPPQERFGPGEGMDATEREVAAAMILEAKKAAEDERLAERVMKLPDIRSDKVQRTRELIARGEFETPERIDGAVRQLMGELGLEGKAVKEPPHEAPAGKVVARVIKTGHSKKFGWYGVAVSRLVSGSITFSMEEAHGKWSGPRARGDRTAGDYVVLQALRWKEDHWVASVGRLATAEERRRYVS